nr:S8 family serine peptidase [Fodinicola feengrottensis]
MEGRIATAIRTAVSLHADVINMSLTTTNDDPSLRAAVAFAEQNDVVVVAAAGNQKQQGNQVQYPAAYPGVLAVAAVKSDGTRAEYSETGSYVSVAAPGEDITGPSGSGDGYVTTNTGAAENGGTSYAAPYVSGLAALVRAYYPKLSAKQVVNRIITTAADGADSGHNDELGTGVINPYQAVNAILSTGSAQAPKSAALATPTNPTTTVTG